MSETWDDLKRNAVSTRSIADDRYDGTKRFGHNPSWVKVADVDALLDSLHLVHQQDRERLTAEREEERTRNVARWQQQDHQRQQLEALVAAADAARERADKEVERLTAENAELREKVDVEGHARLHEVCMMQKDLNAEKAARERADETIETLRLQLAACMAVSIGNTPDSVAQRLTREHPYWSAAYGDVCEAVDREIAQRVARERADAERDAWKAKYEALRVDAEETLRRLGEVSAALEAGQ